MLAVLSLCVSQFERTLIIAEEGSYVSYLEGCTAPAYDKNQVHTAISRSMNGFSKPCLCGCRSPEVGTWQLTLVIAATYYLVLLQPTTIHR